MRLAHPIQLIIADDHEMLRLGFHTMLRKHTDVIIVGEAEDGLELIEKTKALQPDVIITDINMPRMNGIEATRQISKAFPHIGIIGLTMYNEDNLIVDMLEAGARGYIVKTTGKEEILAAIESVAQNIPYYCQHTNIKLASLIANSHYNPHRKKAPPIFSEKEIAIIQLLCQELSNKEAADRMNLSRRTVETYRENIFEKMDVRNLAGLVVYAIRHGLYKI